MWILREIQQISTGKIALLTREDPAQIEIRTIGMCGSDNCITYAVSPNVEEKLAQLKECLYELALVITGLPRFNTQALAPMFAFTYAIAAMANAKDWYRREVWDQPVTHPKRKEEVQKDTNRMAAIMRDPEFKEHFLNWMNEQPETVFRQN
ncbi:MAG: hypothetical protein HY482_00505 [Candidatus Wildermuthbacteria bacterium]|nr:hypothetical protein [Candidatus Wildermuthbacteria bacterium]